MKKVTAKKTAVKSAKPKKVKTVKVTASGTMKPYGK